MADRSLRGMRLGYQSMQSEEGVEYAERRRSTYRTKDGSVFEVTFAADAEIPDTWPHPKSGVEGVLLDPQGKPVIDLDAQEKKGRSHWDMLLERRTREELEELLEERLRLLRARRGQAAPTRRGQEKIGA